MTATRFTKDELSFVHQIMSLLPFGNVPRTPESLVQAKAVEEKTRRMREEIASEPERGALVLTWRIPGALALTMNAYAGSRGWKKHKDRKAIDALLLEILPGFPKAVLHRAHRRRWVRATRFSTQRVDEMAIDVLGGKLPLDSLKRADVVHDDNEEFTHREPRWEKTKRGNTHLLIEVFEMAEHQVAAVGPADSIAPAPPAREWGTFTRAVLGEKEPTLFPKQASKR